MPIPNTNKRACLARIHTFIPVHNAIVYTIHKRASLLRTHASRVMYCTHVSVWSVELWASAAAMCCAPFTPMELFPRLYAHVCERTIQRTCIAHDTRYHTYNRVRAHIYPCIRACRHNKYKHACMPCTNTYLHSSAQCNSIYHTQTCSLLRTHASRVMYCTHLSVWSVELWASAAAMCCAPFTPTELY
jgi:hypothetical protein